MTRLQETHEAVLRQKDAQLDEQRSTIQRLTTQLREKDVRLREMEESHRRRERELLTQLQQKDVELEQKNADISRLQGQVQRNVDISNQAPVQYFIMHVTCSHLAEFICASYALLYRV